MVELIISWTIIWVFNKGNLSVLGFRPTRSGISGFLLFFFITAICCASGFLLRMFFGKEQWELNPALDDRLLLQGVWWNIKAVMFEELIFRGVLFYILIKKLGIPPGHPCFISRFWHLSLVFLRRFWRRRANGHCFCHDRYYGRRVCV